MANSFATGSFTGTGAAVNVSLGWLPSRVECINVTDGDRIDYWITGMSSGTSIAIIGNAGPVLNADNGISTYAGSSSAGPGFTAGTDISESAKVIRWCAWRETNN